MRRWLQLSWREWGVLVAAALATTAARAILLAVPWRTIARSAARTRSAPDRQRSLALVEWAITVCAARLPWSTCLSNALAARWLLARRGMAASIELGTYEAGGEPHFHARVVCDGRELAGHRDMVVLVSLDA